MSLAHKDELDNVQSSFSEIKDKLSQLPVLPTPPVITNVVINNDSNSADIYFTEPDDAQGFILVYKEDVAPENRNDGILIKNVTSPVIVKNLSPQYTYYFVVYAYSIFKKYKKSNIEHTPIRLVNGVRVNKKHIFLEVGQSDLVTATVLPSTAANKEVHWSSSDNNIATVDDTGLITTISEGNCIMTVTTEDGNFTETCEVEILAEVINVTGITLNQYTLGMDIGEEFTLIATITPENATNKYVYWSTSNASIATVDENGLVTCHKKGRAIITAMTDDGLLTADCEIKGAIDVEQILLNRSTLELTKGSTSILTATVQPSDATTLLLWSSSDNNIVTVDQSGRVTALNAGTATITVQAKDVTVTCVVTVTIDVTDIILNKNTVTINKGDVETLTVTIYPEDATDKSFTWSSSNPTIVTVDNGLITGISKGSANITVKTNNGQISDTCTVTVNIPVTGITLNETNLYLPIGYSKKLIATVNPSDASNKNVSWFSNNTDIVEVDNQGNLTFKAVGTATITVTTEDGNYSASCDIQTYIAVTGIRLNKNSLNLNIDESETLIATILPENATNKNIIWSSSNENIATIENGKIIPVGAGNTRIQATTEDGNYSAYCNVTIIIPTSGITLNKNSLLLNVNNSEQLIATVHPENASNQKLIWTSSNTNLVTVSQNGLVTVKGIGRATVSVMTEDGGYIAICIVSADETDIDYVDVTDITLNETDLIINDIGETHQLIATIFPGNATIKNVIWRTLDNSICTVSSEGLITAVSYGQTQVIVSSADGQHTAICDVRISQYLGFAKVPTPNNLFYNGNDQNVTWNDFDNSMLTMSGITHAKDVGEYETIFSLKNHYAWEDNTTEDKIVIWSIFATTIMNKPSTTSDYNYTGRVITPTWTNYNQNQLDIGGDINGTNLGEYNTSFTPKSGYIWEDGTSDPITITWNINPVIILKIPSVTDNLYYTGSDISPRWVNYNSQQLSKSGDESGKNLGEYTTTFTPNYGYTWEDGSTNGIDVTWTINPVTLQIPSTNDLYYTGNEISPNWSNYNPQRLSKSGDDVGKNLGEYTTSFTPNYGYQWEDGTQDTKDISWNILPTTINDTPYQRDRIYFNGNEQSPTWYNYNVNQLKISGTIIGTNVGDYTATFTPLYGYQWRDKSTIPVDIIWTIEPTTVTAIPTTSSLNYNGEVQTPTWNGFNQKLLTISGDTSNSTVGEHIVQFTPVDGVLWWDKTTSSKTASWNIQTTKINKPSIIENYFIYNGENITPQYNDYDENEIAISGDFVAKDAGEYTVTFTPKYGYTWNDGSTTAYSIDWMIDYVQTIKPHTSSTFVYNGSKQSPTWEDYDTSRMTKSGDVWGKDSGTYTTIFTLLDNYIWTDGSKTPYSVNWVIEKAPTSVVPSQSGELIYNGNSQTPSFDNYDSTILTMDGETEGITARTYTVKFTPTNNYYFEDGSEEKSVNWVIKKAVISSIPIQTGNLIYDRNEKSPTWSGYDPKFLNISGVTTAIAASTYTASFTPVSSAVWWDNSSTAKTADWIIQKSATLVVPEQTNELIYNKRIQVPIWSAYDTNLIDIDGETSAYEAGEYEVIFSINDSNYMWKDNTDEDKTVIWEIKSNVISDYPYQVGDLTYNGNLQSPTWANYDEDMYIIAGDISAVDAGNYTARFRPNSNYIWANGTREIYSVEWSINVLKVSKPSLNDDLYEYTGEIITPTWNNYNEDYMSISGQINGTDVDTYTTVFTLNKSCIWADDNTSPYSIDWQIIPAKLSYPSTSSQFTYDGQSHSPVWVNYDENKLTIGGTYEATAKGDYIATFVPKANYTWDDGTRTTYSVSWSIIGRAITIPRVDGTLTYNAEQQSPTWLNYDTDVMTIGGTYTAINAGDYVATFTLNETNYMWEDNTSNEKSISWSIAKADPVLEVYPTTITLDTDHPESGFSVTYTEGATLEFE